MTTISFSYFSTSGFCNVCHSVNAEFESWQKSSHSNVPCVSCHISSGNGIKYILEHVQIIKLNEEWYGYKKPINASSELSQRGIEKETCLRCHSPKIRDFSPSKGLTIDQKKHYRHIEMGLVCTTCHNRIAHASMDAPNTKIKYNKGLEGKHFTYKNYLDMRIGCRRCHNFKSPWSTTVDGKRVTAPVGCTVCHPKNWELLPPGHNSDWIRVHKLEVFKINKLKNSESAGFNFCLRCHIKGAKFEGEDGETLCFSCHSKNWQERFDKAKPKENEILKSKFFESRRGQ